MAKQELMLGDCLKLLPAINDKSISLVISSPPYNLGVNYSKYKDNKERNEYLAWIEKVVVEVRRVLVDQGSFFLNMGFSAKDPWICDDVAQIAGKYFFLQNRIIWVKSLTIENKSYGHFRPINSKRYLNNCHEYLYHFTSSGNVPVQRLSIGVKYQDKTNIKRWKRKNNIRCRGNVWFIPYNTIQSKFQRWNHPAIFPSALAEMCIMLHGFDENTWALDPFSGTGSTVFAAQKLGVNAIGMEVDPEYHAVAFERIFNKDYFAGCSIKRSNGEEQKQPYRQEEKLQETAEVL